MKTRTNNPWYLRYDHQQDNHWLSKIPFPIIKRFDNHHRLLSQLYASGIDKYYWVSDNIYYSYLCCEHYNKLEKENRKIITTGVLFILIISSLLKLRRTNPYSWRATRRLNTRKVNGRSLWHLNTLLSHTEKFWGNNQFIYTICIYPL